MDLRRGLKLGIFSAIAFAVTTAINDSIRDGGLSSSRLIVGAGFTLGLFGIVGTLTDKVGAEFGDH